MARFNETEDIYLDIEYLNKRLSSIQEVQKGILSFQVWKSCNEDSNSYYIRFGQDLNLKNGVYFVFGRELRISDHLLERKTDWTQFIVKQGKVLTSGRKQAFREFLQSGVNSALKRIRNKSRMMVQVHLEKEKKYE